MIIEGPLGRATIVTGPTRERQTQASGTTRFNEVLRTGGQVLLQGAQAALQTLPGGEILCAAVREGANAATRRGGPSGSGAHPTAPGVDQTSGNDSPDDLWELTQRSQEFNLTYLQLQEDLSRENRRFSALSNVLKTRHETARSVISNI